MATFNPSATDGGGWSYTTSWDATVATMTPVSVVLPTLNGASGTLDRAIRTTLDSAHEHIELVIVDDGSTDATWRLINDACERDSRIRGIRNAQNVGLPASLNIGLRAASHPLLTWTSDDNWMGSSFLLDLAASLTDSPDTAIAYGDYLAHTVGDDDAAEPRRVTLPPFESILFTNCIGAAFMFRREVFHALDGYDPNLMLVEDYDFWLRASESFRFEHIGMLDYNYTLHPDSLTSRHGAEIVRLHSRLVVHHAQHLAWPTHELRRRALLRAVRLARREGVWVEAARAAIALLRLMLIPASDR